VGVFKIFNLNEDHTDYLHDESRREGHAEWICFPRSGNEVVQTLEIANQNGWSITVQGGRTGVTGGCVPEGGLILNLSQMNTIENPTGHHMTVEPGATLSAIHTALTGTGLCFPPDPTETSATIGGMVATNASGARSFQYGSVRNWIQALEVVLANGKTVFIERGKQKANGLAFSLGGIEGKLPTIGRPLVKNAAGYFTEPDMDLVDLFIGAEGTLGVVIKIILKLSPSPAETNQLMAFFPTEAEALQFVHLLRSSATKPAAIEFFDFQSLELLRRTAPDGCPKLNPAFHTAIYFEFDCEIPEAILEQAEAVAECWFAEGAHEAEMLRNLRHALPEAVNQIIAKRKREIPQLAKLGTDMSVPDDQLENSLSMYREGLTKAKLEHVIFGHIGNNHLHVNILPHNQKEYKKGKTLHLEWAKKVVAAGGSVSAEHGIGKSKIPLFETMYGTSGTQKMKRLKQLFDSHNCLNPSNLFH
jgi:D-lactate dehydrogenase (cytochrome)